MKMKCPICKRVVKSFTLRDDQKKFYDEDELLSGEAEYHTPCNLCLDNITKAI